MTELIVTMRWVAVQAAGAVVLAACLLAPSASAAAPTVDINSASVNELVELPGIGPAKAAAIVEERSVAPFKSVDDLVRVRGIADTTIAELRDHARVSKPKTE
jgi:competence protein ComEA